MSKISGDDASMLKKQTQVLKSCFLVVFSLCIVGGGSAFSDDWPQWRGPRADSVWREDGIVSELPEGQLPLSWKQPIGPGYSGPTVAEGRVYVTDRVADEAGGVERILCFDAKSGKPLWQVKYEAAYTIGYKAGPRAAVTIHNGRALAVGAMGHFYCLDAKTGDVQWKHDLNEEYSIRMPIWGITASPVIYKSTVIQQVGGADGACMVAFDQETGRELWRSLDDRAQYATPVLISRGGRDLLICWTGDSVALLDPATGDLLSRTEMKPRNMPIGVASPFVTGNRIFVSSFYDGSMMLRIPDGTTDLETIWRRVGQSEQATDSLHCMISGPLVLGDYVYGVDSYGQLRCLNAQNGDRVWEDQTAVPRSRWSTIHMVQHDEDIWMFNERGELLIARLNESGFNERSRCQLIAPTKAQLNRRGGVCWAHPAYANKHVFARNDKELVCASLAE